jgi:hypothetical protein
MSLTIILLLIPLVAVILLIWGLVKRKFKFIAILFLLLSCVIFSSYILLLRSSSFIFTKTTNLNENIGGLQIYENIDSEEFIKKYGTNFERIDNALFDYYKLSNGSLVIATNKQRQIIRILDYNNNLKTSKGIRVGSSVDETIKVYGNNYYKRIDDSKGPVIGYVDKKKKVTLEFFYTRNIVTEISYDITSMQ